MTRFAATRTKSFMFELESPGVIPCRAVRDSPPVPGGESRQKAEGIFAQCLRVLPSGDGTYDRAGFVVDQHGLWPVVRPRVRDSTESFPRTLPVCGRQRPLSRAQTSHEDSFSSR